MSSLPARKNTECGGSAVGWTGSDTGTPGGGETVPSLVDPQPLLAWWEVNQCPVWGRCGHPPSMGLEEPLMPVLPGVPVDTLEAAMHDMRPSPQPSFPIRYLNGQKKLMHLSNSLCSKDRIIF